MSLLLDARKKSQQAQGAELELSLEEFSATSPMLPESRPVEQARSAGQNLFNAKSHAPSAARASISRNLLIALGAAILLLAAGGGYVWYAISPSPTQPLRAMPPPVAPSNIVPNIPPAHVIAEAKPVEASIPAKTARPPRSTTARKRPAMQIEQHQTEPIDPVLADAYRAYLAGKFDQAQQLYKRALTLDARNTDALLGLAAIAQRSGADKTAAHYYAQVLELDPRDAVANAGMSALTTGGNSESRLKNLLHEQQDSSALHFALGNRYASEARWGEAQQEYFNAYKLETGNAELAFNLAVSLDRLGQAKLAVQYYQRALELDTASSARFDHAKISQRIEELNR